MGLADARADGREAGEGSEGNCAALMGECVESPR